MTSANVSCIETTAENVFWERSREDSYEVSHTAALNHIRLQGSQDQTIPDLPLEKYEQ